MSKRIISTRESRRQERKAAIGRKESFLIQCVGQDGASEPEHPVGHYVPARSADSDWSRAVDYAIGNI